jgi:hypothetical protein
MNALKAVACLRAALLIVSSKQDRYAAPYAAKASALIANWIRARA